MRRRIKTQALRDTTALSAGQSPPSYLLPSRGRKAHTHTHSCTHAHSQWQALPRAPKPYPETKVVAPTKA